MNTTDVKALPARPSVEQYKKQAKELVKACKAADSEAIKLIRKYHPRYRIPVDAIDAARLRSGQSLDADVDGESVTLADAQLVIAREHGFESWPKLTKHIEGLRRGDRFESAVNAIVSGDLATLERLLRQDPELIRARSTRAHRATLLHYVAANGVENYRQKTPANIVEIARLLLDVGAEVDAIADAYGKSAALGLVATSIHPLRAGVQNPLMNLLLSRGAAIDGPAQTGRPIDAALLNVRFSAAEYLAERGAKIGVFAAGALGRIDLLKQFFDEDGSLKNPADRQDMNLGFVWACSYGRVDAVEFLLDRGADLRANENVGQTALHQAVIRGDLTLIELLLKRGAPLEAKNVYGGTALRQAMWCAASGDRDVDYAPVIQMLIEAGAKEDME